MIKFKISKAFILSVIILYCYTFFLDSGLLVMGRLEYQKVLKLERGFGDLVFFHNSKLTACFELLLLYTFFYDLMPNDMIFIAAQIKATNPCTFSVYVDGCGNHGWLWNCSHRRLTKIPQDIPIKYKNAFLSLDVSGNNFKEISTGTFKSIKQEFRSNITGLNLQGNYLTSIGNFSFQSLNRRC